MQILGLILALISIGAVAGPVAGVVLVYQNNPVEMIVPSEIEDLIVGSFGADEPFELPQYVSSSFDPSTQTLTALFSFANPFELDLRVNSLSAGVECAIHAFNLGHAELVDSVPIDAGDTALIPVVFKWTQAAEDHFLTAHSGAASIDIELVNLGVDVSGITIETPESVSVNVPLPQ
jgi:hypothetical protein